MFRRQGLIVVSIQCNFNNVTHIKLLEYTQP